MRLGFVVHSLDEQEEETTGEKLQAGFQKVGDKLSEWGVLSPRLMLAGGGLFMTLSNWGLLPAVRLGSLFGLTPTSSQY